MLTMERNLGTINTINTVKAWITEDSGSSTMIWHELVTSMTIVDSPGTVEDLN